ncbi:ATP phosphoribosyltransferase [Caldinitratiruptor microaerophilus]|uniref:ATP phosphoribosyltransferase n=1 Tax=Caldinitratiruptor microaerophilus TaxID=671077 RepID=A0AA35CPD5_9FIRM|nr:ATP phosphoribosyltransferase [Caldinitratiruptor microaerophilus]BDG61271.1 ATP phosphoribosyltransferase [Caldinitratiruptor microaerophilus]
MNAALLTLAVPKGRPLGPTLDLLARAGIGSARSLAESRSLVAVLPEAGMRFILARPSDVPTYVEHGAADLGIVGKDVLAEGRHQVYELLDLGYLRCRFVVAGPAGTDPTRLLDGAGHLRVATKYPRVAEEYFRRRGIQAEVIYLAGSVEVAPQVGLADLIVDISETGRTLAENGLVVLDTVMESTARLIANRASYRLRGERIAPFIQALREAVSGAPAV